MPDQIVPPAQVHRLLVAAVDRQMFRCDHVGAGQPGCYICDPVLRAAVEQGRAVRGATPEELDVMLASLLSAQYATQCLEIVEKWIEKHFGLISASQSQLRAEGLRHDFASAVPLARD